MKRHIRDELGKVLGMIHAVRTLNYQRMLPLSRFTTGKVILQIWTIKLYQFLVVGPVLTDVCGGSSWTYARSQVCETAGPHLDDNCAIDRCKSINTIPE